jgi:cell wall-associated NlpC family hydrolase
MQIRITLFLLLFLVAVAGKSNNWKPASEIALQEKVDSLVDRSALITFAKKYLGTPYRTAGSNPKKGFDCSGFVNFVFRNFMINLPRSSREFKSIGTSLKPEEFKEGDVVVFYSFRNKARIGHVGIICEANGMKSKFIHSASGQHKGIMISSLSAAMYAKRFFRCIDVLEGK